MQILNGDKLTSIEFKKPTKKGGPRNERDVLIEDFTNRLQAEWKPFYFDKFKKKHKVQPWTTRRVAVKLSYLKSVQDLYYLMSVCKESTNFSAMFNHLTKVKSVPKSQAGDSSDTIF